MNDIDNLIEFSEKCIDETTCADFFIALVSDLDG